MTTKAETLGPRPAVARRDVVAHSLAFIAGFTLVFVAAGATASALGQAFAEHRRIITQVFGFVVILLGLNMLGLFKLRFLAMDKRLQIHKSGVSYVGSFLVGIGFAAGWSPCLGPIVSAVIALAANAKTVAAGTWLLFVYSAGLGLGFFATAIGLQFVMPLLTKMKRYLPVVDIVAGVIVTGFGIVLATSSFLRFVAWLYQTFPALQNLGTGPELSATGEAVSMGAAFIAGLVSFISPCVLPLVPAYISFLTGQTIESLVAAYEHRAANAKS